MQKLIHNTIEWLPKSLQPSPKLGVAMTLALTLATAFWFGCFGAKLFERPDSERFLATFFKEPFWVMIGLFIAWYTSSFKHSPSRIAEYQFLNSLPMSAERICDRFIYQDLLRYAWVPGFVSFLYLGLLPLAPISHLSRLAILAVFSFFLFVISNTALHFLVVLRRKKSRKYVYPRRNNPMIIAFLIFGYSVLQLSFIIQPSLASGYQFGITLGLLVIGSYSILSLARLLFRKWQMKNVAFLCAAKRATQFRSSWIQISNPFHLFPGVNPVFSPSQDKILRLLTDMVAKKKSEYLKPKSETSVQPMESKTKAIMEVESIELTYGRNPIIANLSTKIYSRSFIGLIGPNGAGKTTLLRSLSGQFKPKRGRILFENRNIYQSNIEFKQKVGYVHENPFSYPYLSVEEFLHFVARVKNVPKLEIAAQTSAVLESVCLDEERRKLTAELSMGMRKKLAIAGSLLGNPKIIFLDEALNGIDVESAFKIKHVLQDLVAGGRTIILSSHVLEVIEKICDRYLVLKNGEIIADLEANRFKETDLAGKDMDLEKYIIQLLET